MSNGKVKLKLANFNFKNLHNKKYFNLHLYTEIAPKYKSAKWLLSFGRDKAWKKKMMKIIKKYKLPENAACLDLACGTGDIAFNLTKMFPLGEIWGLDLNPAMLDLAKHQNKYKQVKFKEGDMCKTGLDSKAFDLIAGGFALYNAPDLEIALNEIYRMMKPGAKAIFLDFYKSHRPFWQKLRLKLLKFWGNFWSFIQHGNPDLYGYIAKSLELIPDHRNLRQILTNLKFINIKIKTKFFGFIMVISFEKKE